MASETTVPERKNGSALAKYTSARVALLGSPVRDKMNHSDATTHTLFASPRVPSLAYRFPRHADTT